MARRLTVALLKPITAPPAVGPYSSTRGLNEDVNQCSISDFGLKRPSPTAFFGHPRWHSVATGTRRVFAPLRLTLPEDTQPRTSVETDLLLTAPGGSDAGCAPAAVACSRRVLE